MPLYSLWSMKERGLSVDLRPDLLRACLPMLRRYLGNKTYERYEQHGWIEAPMLLHLDGVSDGCRVEAAEAAERASDLREGSQGLEEGSDGVALTREGVSGSTKSDRSSALPPLLPLPLPAWRPQLLRGTRCGRRRGHGSVRVLLHQLAAFSRSLSWWRLGDDPRSEIRNPKSTGYSVGVRDDDGRGGPDDYNGPLCGRDDSDIGSSGGLGSGSRGAGDGPGVDDVTVQGPFSLALSATEEAYAWVRLRRRTYRLAPKWGWLGELSMATSQWPPSTFMWR